LKKTFAKYVETISSSINLILPTGLQEKSSIGEKEERGKKDYVLRVYPSSPK